MGIEDFSGKQKEKKGQSQLPGVLKGVGKAFRLAIAAGAMVAGTPDASAQSELQKSTEDATAALNELRAVLDKSSFSADQMVALVEKNGAAGIASAKDIEPIVQQAFASVLVSKTAKRDQLRLQTTSPGVPPLLAALEEDISKIHTERRASLVIIDVAQISIQSALKDARFLASKMVLATDEVSRTAIHAQLRSILESIERSRAALGSLRVRMQALLGGR